MQVLTPASVQVQPISAGTLQQGDTFAVINPSPATQWAGNIEIWYVLSVSSKNLPNTVECFKLDDPSQRQPAMDGSTQVYKIEGHFVPFSYPH